MLGAALGAVTRFAVGEVLPFGAVTLLLINVVGCFFMGLTRPGPFWGMGFLGGLTSYSTYAVAVAQPELYWSLFATPPLCVAAVWLGERCARR